MSNAVLTYQLVNGYIHNWLVAGPEATPVSDLGRFQGEDYKLQIARHYYASTPGYSDPPIEPSAPRESIEKPFWRYYRCRDDHLVDLTAFYHTTHYLRAWAYARVESPDELNASFVLTTNGPADAWLNGAHVHRQEHFRHQIPHSVPFRAPLQAGSNEILVRMEEVAARECPYAMALQIVDLAGAEVPVTLPTDIKNVARRQKLERVFEAAYLERDLYVFDDQIVLRWPDDLEESASVTVRLQVPAGRIYAESERLGTAGNHSKVSYAYQLPAEPFHVVLMPRAKEYYERNMRVTRTLDLWAIPSRYSAAPYDSYAERRGEALREAARRGYGVYGEIAKMALGQWDQLKTGTILEAVEGINSRADCSDFYLVGLLGAMHRHGDEGSFPEELKAPLEQCVLDFRYWMDEPGSDAMCFWSENHQILFHACEIMAGQLYPDRVFTNNGQTGQWHREKGERMALSWLRKRGSGGFREWDSNCYFEEDLLAVAHLLALAETQQVWDLAAVVMDKMLFSMALNSFKGVFGSTHGRSYAPFLIGGALEPTSGVSRMVFGVGAFNAHVRGTVGVATAEYQLPRLIQSIATDDSEEMWNRERHAGELEEWCDLASGPWEVNKVTYRTPDYMLSSAQDHHPGERGVQQHIWQATLGPDAVVFVTHPPCMSLEGSHRPNFWHGNVVLPRVAQWKGVLIDVRNLPEDDWLGFTHAYFPVAAFDEHALRESGLGHTWAFARKGEGYIALTAAQRLVLVTRGDSAYRELRSYGQKNVWLCHMGRAALDGDFVTFQEQVLELEVTFEGLSVRCNSLRGQSLAFGWEGPLALDGKEQPITGFKHYENPFCVAELPAEEMVIRYGDTAMQLEFGT